MNNAMTRFMMQEETKEKPLIVAEKVQYPSGSFEGSFRVRPVREMQRSEMARWKARKKKKFFLVEGTKR